MVEFLKEVENLFGGVHCLCRCWQAGTVHAECEFVILNS